MSDFPKKQVGYKALRKRLKAKDRAIQRLRNRVAWLELQLTLHFAEDQNNEEDFETHVIEDDCTKCQQLRNLLDECSQLPLIPELRALHEDDLDVPNETIPFTTDPESAVSGNQQDVMLTIDPSRHSISGNLESSAPREPSGEHGIFGGSVSDNICCAFIVVVAIWLINCM